MSSALITSGTVDISSSAVFASSGERSPGRRGSSNGISSTWADASSELSVTGSPVPVLSAYPTGMSIPAIRTTASRRDSVFDAVR